MNSVPSFANTMREPKRPSPRSLPFIHDSVTMTSCTPVRAMPSSRPRARPSSRPSRRPSRTRNRPACWRRNSDGARRRGGPASPRTCIGGRPEIGVGSSVPPRIRRSRPARSVTSRSPFGSHAMPHGCDNSRATIETRILCSSAVSRTTGAAGSGTSATPTDSRPPRPRCWAEPAAPNVTIETANKNAAASVKLRPMEGKYNHNPQGGRPFHARTRGAESPALRFTRRPHARKNRPGAGSRNRFMDGRRLRGGQEPRLAGVLRRQRQHEVFRRSIKSTRTRSRNLKIAWRQSGVPDELQGDCSRTRRRRPTGSTRRSWWTACCT